MKNQSTPHTQQYIEEQFSQRNCKLLSIYKNNKTKVDFKCKCGNISQITYKSFNNGSYCMGCSGKRKHTNEEIKKVALERGCELLSEYINAHSKIKIKCQCGLIYDTTWNNFREKRACKDCGNKKISQSLKHNFNFVKSYFEKNGCKLLSDSYSSTHKTLNYICICGNSNKISFANFQSGQRCKICRSNNMKGNKHPLWQIDRELAKLKITISSRCHAHIKSILKKQGLKKLNKSEILLGYTQKELFLHIIQHPNWIKVKNKLWHIDHIFPIKAFFDYKIHDLAIINCLENLQPMDKSSNLKKNAKYNKKQFEKWLVAKLRNYGF